MKRSILVVMVAMVVATIALMAAPAVAEDEMIGSTIGEQVEAHPAICHAKADDIETIPC